ncbi:MAG TPA: hypothetical protein VJB95_02805 [Candidatus Paceibacterota bacterium]
MIPAIPNDNMFRYNALESRLPPMEVSLSIVASSAVHNIALSPWSTYVDPKEYKEEEIMGQVEEIARSRDSLKKEVEEEINRLKRKTRVGTFIIGSDLGRLRFQLVQIDDRIYRLTILGQRAAREADQLAIGEEIERLKNEQSKIEDFIKDQEEKFSLFGWLVAMI